MSVRPFIAIPVLLILLSAAFQPLSAQLGFRIDVKKPKPYEQRVLKAEKTGDKKLKATKRFFQNLTTHYNFYFNASTKLNDIIERAKASHKDDYATLLPFYNYTLNQTAQDNLQLDSVIYKSQTAIVMHDLRNDWMDNMYMLWGAAYYFQKKFDSASLMFQFINYAFADKEKDGYYRYIGSRMDGNSAISITTKENNSLLKKVFSTSPSRNEAFIWQARTLIESGNLTEAGSLLATLQNDPLFPERLHEALEELEAYWYYKQGVWDSAATHLSNALGEAKNKGERARWEYLAAQMFERTGQVEKAEKLYAKAIGHTTDPMMDVYARLNLVRINKAGGENYIDQNIAQLLKMAKKDKYEDYRDVVYFMAAQMEMQRNNLAAAQELLLMASKYNNGNLTSRNNAFLLIANLSFDQKKYLQAAAFYDSLQTGELSEEDLKKVEYRKSSLKKIVINSKIITLQDSLQHIASFPEEERKTYLTKLVKQLRRQQGLAEENALTSGIINPNANATEADLFNNNNKGEWYFYNATLKTQGIAQFKQLWGNRPNVDNWRRFADVSSQLLAQAPNNTRNPTGTAVNTDAIDNTPSYNSLLNNLPLTEEALLVSNGLIKNALFDLCTAYVNNVEDYASAIETFEKLRSRFPSFEKMDEVLFNLYYAYKKTGNEAKAAEIKALLFQKYASSRFYTIVTTGKDPASTAVISPQATKDYETIYDLFIEGRFEEAEAAKKKADSVYRTNYWQPQLLYIEAVYHIKQRDDSVAKNILRTLIAQNTASPLVSKAKTLLDVLSRRREIEDELTRLQIQRPKEDSAAIEEPVVQLPVRKDSIVLSPKKDVVVNPPVKRSQDIAVKKPLIQQKAASVYTFDAGLKHYAMIILEKVDIVFGNETKNAFNRYNQEKYYNQTIPINAVDLDADHKLILLGEFNNAQEAVEYVQQAKKLATTEIVPWLKPEKYSFSIMSKANLEILESKKDLNQYKKFLEQYLPVKF